MIDVQYGVYRIYVYKKKLFYELCDQSVIAFTIRGKQIKKMTKIITITHKSRNTYQYCPQVCESISCSLIFQRYVMEFW